MKAFKYSLQALRTLRQRQEQGALQKYAQANQHRLSVEARLHSIQGELDAARATMHGRILAGTTILQISQLQAYCQAVAQRAQQCTVELRAAERIVETTWRQLVAARRDLEVVEQHHQKQRQRHERELEKAEQKRLDEITTRGGPFATLNVAPAGHLWN
ncbi:MAG: flagellar export protein FliJ [Verrucomicrobia bacterium]|nr:flagellar export protein FliJ [Verrucomicrobiota bacterium]